MIVICLESVMMSRAFPQEGRVESDKMSSAISRYTVDDQSSSSLSRMSLALSFSQESLSNAQDSCARR